MENKVALLWIECQERYFGLSRITAATLDAALARRLLAGARVPYGYMEIFGWDSIGRSNAARVRSKSRVHIDLSVSNM